MAGTTTKRSVAACCLLVVVLLSGQQQQQAAAMSKFCRCYNQCYTDCRKHRGTFPCNFECLQDCINGRPDPPLPRRRRPASPAADCNYACLIRTCGVMDDTTGTMATPPAPGDAEACVSECIKKLASAAPTPSDH